MEDCDADDEQLILAMAAILDGFFLAHFGLIGFWKLKWKEKKSNEIFAELIERALIDLIKNLSVGRT